MTEEDRKTLIAKALKGETDAERADTPKMRYGAALRRMSAAGHTFKDGEVGELRALFNLPPTGEVAGGDRVYEDRVLGYLTDYPPKADQTPDGSAGSFPHAEDGYDDLRSVLYDALHQATSGKGRERHANGKAFADQPMIEIAKMVGTGFTMGQAMKKTQEARGMHQRGETEAAVQELLGAMVYLAGTVLVMRGDV